MFRMISITFRQTGRFCTIAGFAQEAWPSIKRRVSVVWIDRDYFAKNSSMEFCTSPIA